MKKDWKFYVVGILLVGIIIGASVTMCAEAAEPPSNVQAVRDGTSMMVTWEHTGDAKSFSVWQAREDAPGKIFSGSVVDATSRTSTFDVPDVVAAPQLCDIYVVARYLPELPNEASEKVCATDGGIVPATDPDPGATGTKRLDWTPPTEREDGTPLAPSEIYGYEVFYDTVNPPVNGQVTNVNDSAAKTHLITNLPPGTWYSGVKTVDTEQQVSDLSNIVSFVIEEEQLPVDTTPPVITLRGDDPMIVRIRTTYEEPGADCVDETDGVLNPIITGDVNMAQLGEYTTMYTCKDAASNTATATRTIQVIRRGKPKAPAGVGVVE